MKSEVVFFFSVVAKACILLPSAVYDGKHAEQGTAVDIFQNV